MSILRDCSCEQTTTSTETGVSLPNDWTHALHSALTNHVPVSELDEVQPLVDGLQNDILTGLTAEERAQFLALGSKVIAAADRD